MITIRKVEISERYLSEDERVAVADLRRQRHSLRAIAAKIGRSPSTISRELRRNRDPERGQYRPFVAHKLAVDRRARPGRGKIVNDDALRELLEGDWLDVTMPGPELGLAEIGHTPEGVIIGSWPDAEVLVRGSDGTESEV